MYGFFNEIEKREEKNGFKQRTNHLKSEKGTFIHGKGIVYLLQTARFPP